MLQVSFLREEKERVLEGLKKRNFKQLELVDEAIQLDDERKKTQQELDSQLAEINKISKEIGKSVATISTYANRLKKMGLLRVLPDGKLKRNIKGVKINLELGI